MKAWCSSFMGLALLLAGCQAPGHPTGSASPETSSVAPAPSATASPPPTASPSPVSAGFSVTDLSFAGGEAFALGGSGGQAMLAESSDSGATWQFVGQLPVPICATGSNPCVDRVRFGSTEVGYAFGLTTLLITHDGGHAWTQQNTASYNGTVDLAAYGPSDAVRAYGSAPCGCTLEPTTDGGLTWHDTGVAPTSGGNSDDRVLIQSGVAYATQLGNTAGGGEGNAAVYVSLDAGATWTAKATPCGQMPLTGDMAATTNDVVAVICVDRSTQPSTLTMRISRDGAEAFGGASAPIPGGGFDGILAVAGPSVAAVASGGVYVTTDEGAHWRMALSCSASWLGFESAADAHALCGNTVWRSSDAGTTWSSYTFA